MTVWIIEPHDPLIVRDGRPFGPNPNARAVSLPFPFPSTTTGGVRTRAGLDANGAFDKSKTNTVKQIKVRGPLLVELDTSGHPTYFVHAPGDALLLEPEPPEKGKLLCRQLRPLKFLGEVYTNIPPNGNDPLLLVGLNKYEPNKPAKDAPQFWHWEKFEQWLIDPTQLSSETIKEPLTSAELGHNGPQYASRIHVSMETDQRTAKEGALFQTTGLEFTSKRTKLLSEAQRLALAVDVDNWDVSTLEIQEGIASLGGERRMVCWRKSDEGLPQCPDKVRDGIIADRACRVILLTPACFKDGYRPGWIVEDHFGIKPKLEAIAVQRPHVVSGWDFEKGRPKPTRRLAAAGTVLFLSFMEASEADIQNWINGMWMQCISDEELDRNDGFGMAALGTWSGTATEWKAK